MLTVETMQLLDLPSGCVMQYKCVVAGVPTPKARARTVRLPNGRISTYTPAKTRAGEANIRYALEQRKVPFYEASPLYLRAVFVRSWPKGMSRKRRETAIPTTRPDTDQYIKSLMDAMTGVAWRDDSQVAFIIAATVYGPEPQTYIEVGALSEGEWLG